MKKIILTLIATVLVSNLAMASESKSATELKGRVVENVNGVEQPVQFACVYCEGTTISAYTNENGEFMLPVEKAGKYTLRFSHAGYSLVQKDVKVKKNATNEDIALSRENIMLTAR